MFQIIPRMEQMEAFLKACREGVFSNEEETFLHTFEMSSEQLQLLREFGLFSWQTPLERLEQQCERTKELKLDQLIVDTIKKCVRDYPVSRMLHVEHFLMDEKDDFGRERLQGVSAFATYEGQICLIVWPDTNAGKILQSTVVHEYHHHWRIAELGLQECDETLLERLVFEGLAEHFVGEVLGEAWQGPWVKMLSEQEAKRLWPVYQGHLQEKGAVATPYLFGSEELGIPFWGGYSLGYQLVKAYRQQHPELTIAELTRLAAEEYARGFAG